MELSKNLDKCVSMPCPNITELQYDSTADPVVDTISAEYNLFFTGFPNLCVCNTVEWMNNMNLLHKAYRAFNFFLTELIPNKYILIFRNMEIGIAQHHRYPRISSFLRKNKAVENAYQGKRCFILGNGPSLKNVDFSILKSEYVFTVNFSPKIENFSKLNTNFHVWTDMYMYTRQPSFGEEIARVLRMLSGSCEVKPKCFFNINMYPLIKEYQLDQELDIHYINNCKYFYDGCNTKFDYTKPMFDYASVVFTAVSLAVYMGFSEIYLLGCDATGILGVIDSRKGKVDSSHAYKTDAANETLFQFYKDKLSIEHYFKSWYEIFHNYSEMYRYCKDHGIKLVNCTEGTLVESVPWQSLDSVLHGDSAEKCKN